VRHTDLVKLPPIAADPISNLVLGNKACLQEIKGKISQLHAQITALQESTSKVEANISTAPSPLLSNAVRAVSSSVAGVSGQLVSGLKSADKRAGNLIVLVYLTWSPSRIWRNQWMNCLTSSLAGQFLSMTCVVWVVERRLLIWWFSVVHGQ